MDSQRFRSFASGLSSSISKLGRASARNVDVTAPLWMRGGIDLLGITCVGGNATLENTKLKETTISTKGRHDPCVGIRAVPVGEAMVATTIADHCLRFL